MNRFDELVSLYLDGEPTQSELDELAEILRSNRDLAKDFREQLVVWEHFSQSVAPERTPHAFEEAVQMRLRAESDARHFHATTRKRIRFRQLLRFLPPAMAAVLLFGLMIWFMQTGQPPTVDLNLATVIPLRQSVSVTGESVCTKCTLHLEGSHNKAIRFANGTGEIQVLLLMNAPDLRQHTGNFCGGPKKVQVEGETLQEGGIPLLAVSTLEFLE